MRLFQKKSSPKKLSIRDMWRLHRALKDGLVGNRFHGYMLEEVIGLMEKIDIESFKNSLKLMWGDDVDYGSKTPVDLALMFTDGLKRNNAFEFFEFVGALTVVPSK